MTHATETNAVPPIVPVGAVPQAHDPSAFAGTEELISLLRAASGASIDHVRDAYAFYRQMQADKARDAYYAARAAFGRDIPRITKNRDAKKSSDAGAPKMYSYADLPTIAEAIKDPLGRHGLSYSFLVQEFTDKCVTVVCRVAHHGGHYEDYPPVTMPVEGTSMMSASQKRGATQSYAMRYALIAALAITSAEDDTDGRAHAPRETISEAQAHDLESYIVSVGANRAAMLAAYNVTRVEDMTPDQAADATRKLHKKYGGSAE